MKIWAKLRDGRWVPKVMRPCDRLGRQRTKRPHPILLFAERPWLFMARKRRCPDCYRIYPILKGSTMHWCPFCRGQVCFTVDRHFNTPQGQVSCIACDATFIRPTFFFWGLCDDCLVEWNNANRTEGMRLCTLWHQMPEDERPAMPPGTRPISSEDWAKAKRKELGLQ